MTYNVRFFLYANLPSLYFFGEVLVQICCPFLNCFLFFNCIYLLLERGEGRKTERKRNISARDQLPLARPHLGTWPATQACAPTRNRTDSLLIHRLVLNPLRHTSQGIMLMLNYLEPVRFFWFYNLACVFFLLLLLFLS